MSDAAGSFACHQKARQRHFKIPRREQSERTLEVAGVDHASQQRRHENYAIISGPGTLER
ncbi:MAG: hypothetical protein ABI128_10015 [Rhodanobacter sp.]